MKITFTTGEFNIVPYKGKPITVCGRIFQSFGVRKSDHGYAIIHIPSGKPAGHAPTLAKVKTFLKALILMTDWATITTKNVCDRIDVAKIRQLQVQVLL